MIQMTYGKWMEVQEIVCIHVRLYVYTLKLINVPSFLLIPFMVLTQFSENFKKSWSLGRWG
jgi:hypothetical protein